MEKTIYSNAYAAFCRVIRDTREAKGITQTRLAHALNRPQSFVAKIESGQRRVDVVELIALAKGLGCSPVDLVERLAKELERETPPLRERATSRARK